MFCGKSRIKIHTIMIFRCIQSATYIEDRLAYAMPNIRTTAYFYIFFTALLIINIDIILFACHILLKPLRPILFDLYDVQKQIKAKSCNKIKQKEQLANGIVQSYHQSHTT